jgi:hypothetical protein
LNSVSFKVRRRSPQVSLQQAFFQAVIELVLSAVGLMSYVVRRRTREIGIRLGAEPGRVLRMISRQGS